MSTKFAVLLRLVVCSAVVGAMAFGVLGCEKEAEQAEPATEETSAGDVTTTPAMAPSMAGVYRADTPTGQKVTLMLNEDNTASMTVEYPAGQAPATQTGTWAQDQGAGTVNFTYGAEGASMTVPLTIHGEHLHVGGEMAASLGVSDVTLVKEGSTAPVEEPEAGPQN